MTLTAEVKTADLALPEGATFRLSMTPAGRLKVDSLGGGGGGNVNIVGINGGTAIAANAGAADAATLRVVIASNSTVAIGGSATFNAGSVGATSTLITLANTGTFQVAGTIGATIKGGYIQNRGSVDAEVFWGSSTAVVAGVASTRVTPAKAIPLSLGNDFNIYQGVVSVAGTSGMQLVLVQST